jgi:hypothetical protein
MYRFKSNIKKRFWNVLELSEGKYDPVSKSEEAHIYNTFEHFLKKHGYSKSEDNGDQGKLSYIGHSPKEKSHTMLNGKHYVDKQARPVTGYVNVYPASGREIEYSSKTRKDASSLMYGGNRSSGYKGHRIHIHYKGDMGETHEMVNSAEDMNKVLERWHKAHHQNETIREDVNEYLSEEVENEEDDYRVKERHMQHFDKVHKFLKRKGYVHLFSQHEYHGERYVSEWKHLQTNNRVAFETEYNPDEHRIIVKRDSGESSTNSPYNRFKPIEYLRHNLNENKKDLWYNREYRNSSPMDTKKGLRVQGHHPKDAEGFDDYDKPYSKTAVHKLYGSKWPQYKRRVVGPHDIVVAKKYPPMRTDDPEDYDPDILDYDARPSKVAMIRVPKKLKESRTNKGYYTFTKYPDNDSDNPASGAYVVRTTPYGRDPNRKRRTGSQIKKDLQSDKEKRYEETILKMYGPELAPYVPRPKKY